MRKLCWLLLFALLLVPFLAYPLTREEEIQIGREAAAEVEKEYKLSDDKDLLDKVDKIGKTIAAVSEDPSLPWTFKVVVSDEVNAFTLPGGFIYITTGLLNFVRTDDELAGVIAHEIAHAARHHFIKLAEQQAKTERQLAPFLLAALLGTQGSDLENIYLGLQLVEIAKMHSYGQALEEDADLAGARYLILSKKYNPAGILTFLQRLARMEERGVKQELGILQTHPYAKERTANLLTFLRSTGSEFNERKAAGLYKLSVRPQGVDVTAVYIDDQLIAQFTGENGKRAGEILAENLDQLLDQNLRVWEVSAKLLPNGNPAVVARNKVLIEITTDILPDKGKDPLTYAQTIAGNIRQRLLKEFINQIY
ncbi:M48 family metalloprotease [bacterium]|nr:M48 family metalloprotease [bacterium]